MSLGSRSILPELLAAPGVRAARRGKVAVILDGSLDRLLFADATGRRIFGLPADGTLPPLLARQLRSGQRRVAEGGVARLLLRPPVGRAALPVAASMSGIGAGAKAVLLVADSAEAAVPAIDASSFLADMSLAEEAAALLDDAGALVAAGRDFPAILGESAELRQSARETIAAQEASRDLQAGGFNLRLDLVADGWVLVRAESLPATSYPDEASPAASMNIAAIVGRWHDRTSDDVASAEKAAQRRPLRSIWGTIPTPPEAEMPPLRASTLPEDLPASPTDVPGDEADEQPIDRPSVVTLPDVPADEAAGIEWPHEENDEHPHVEDLVPVPDELPPEIVRQETPFTADRENPGASHFAPSFDRPPARFVWQIDRDGRFRSLSPEFALAVGPKAADVLGRGFADVADAFGFDESGEVRRLLERRDTWSGRTVFWPVENSDRRVPIDLAALPTYSRDRSFDGFRGFGIVRTAESVADPKATGLSLLFPTIEPVADPAFAAEEEPSEPMRSAGLRLRSFESELPGVAFGRRPAPPSADPVDATEKVIRLGERRRPREGALSETEEAAFRAIGAKLGKPSERDATKRPIASTEIERTVEAEPILPDMLPAAELPFADAPDMSSAADGPRPSDEIATGDNSEFEASASPDDATAAMLSVLPLPVLVQARDEIVHANDALLGLLGHPSLDSLTAAGGLDTLFAEREEGSPADEMMVRRADGETVPARVKMQRIAFEGRSSLMMSFEPTLSARPDGAFELDDLRREIGELKAVLDIATDGVVLVGPDANVRAVNGPAEALFGLGAEEFQGRSLASLFAPDHQKTVLDYIEMLKDRGLAGVLNDGREVMGREAQGGFVPLFITAGRLSEERGWCVVIRDIAHWKRNEEELVNARRAAEAASLHKSRFLANITHELRTPLNAIIGFADVMASECFGPIGNERYIEYLGDIKRSGHHVLDLVNDLLDIAKIESGKMELSFESVSLNEVLAEVVSVMQPQANRERVIVRSNLPPSVPPVVADRRTIRQIALNLLSNSVRFTPAGGQIIASTTYTAEGDVVLRVRDSGIGMTEREIEIALTPFQQVHQPGDERGHGTGLGLPLTKAMAEANRASFEIRSKPGEGTLVEISFPAQRVLAR